MSDGWYFNENGERKGPIDLTTLKQLVSSGRVGQEAMVWREGMSDWVQAGAIKELFPQTSSIDPPPLPPVTPAQPSTHADTAIAKSPVVVGGIAAGGCLLCLVFCCGLMGLAGGSRTSGNRGATAVVEATPEEIITISAQQLFHEYDANDIAADQKYKGKILEVSGSVDNISRDILDTIYVTLKTREFELFNIQCFFADDFEDRAAQLQPRQYLRIRGRCDGKFGNVMLKSCVIVE